MGFSELQLDRAQKQLDRPDLKDADRAKLVQMFGQALEARQLQQQQNNMFNQMQTGQEQAGQPPQQAGQPPQQAGQPPQQAGQPPQQAGQPPQQPPGEEDWGVPSRMFVADPSLADHPDAMVAAPRFDQAAYQLEQAYTTTSPYDTNPIDLDDPQSIAFHRKRQKQDAEREGRQLGLQSASQRPSLYAAPEAGFEGAGTKAFNPYLHHEPEVEKVQAIYMAMAHSASEMGESQKAEKFLERAQEIQDTGEEADAYQNYADWEWQQVASIANNSKVPQRAIRVAFTQDDQYDTPKVQQVGLAMADGFLGGFGLLPAAIDAFSDRKDSPIARQLLQSGLGIGKGEYTRMSDEAPMWANIVGAGLGLAVAGPGKAMQTAIGGAAKKMAKGTAGRLAADLALNFGVDTSASLLRQGLEALSEGKDFSADLGQASIEGLVGAGIGAATAGGGAVATGAHRRIGRDPNIRMQSQAGNVAGHGFGEKWNLERDLSLGKGASGRPRLELGPRARIEDNLIRRSVDASEPSLDISDPRGTAGTLGEASRYTAEKTLPQLQAATQRRMQKMEFIDAAYARTEEASKRLPVTRAFRGLQQLVNDTKSSSRNARKKAMAALHNISDKRVVGPDAAEAIQTRIREGNFVEADVMVIPYSKARDYGIADAELAELDDVFTNKQSAEALNLQKDKKARDHNVAFATPLAEEGTRLPALFQDSSYVPGESWHPEASPMGDMGPAPADRRADILMKDDANYIDELGARTLEDVREGLTGGYMKFLSSRTETPKPKEGFQAVTTEELTNPGVKPRRRGKGLGSGLLSPAEEEKFVVLSPKKMNPLEFEHAIRDLDESLFNKSGEAGGSFATRQAAADMRAMTEQWPGLAQARKQKRKLLTEMEGIESSTGLTRREMSGDFVDETDAQTVRDMSLTKLAKYIETKAYVPDSGNARSSQALGEYLENPKLVRLLKAVRATEAYMNQTGAASFRVGGNISGGAFGIFPNLLDTLKDWAYRPLGVRRRLQEQGKMPVVDRVLFTPEARQFLASTDGETLRGLLEAQLDKEIAEEDK